MTQMIFKKVVPLMKRVDSNLSEGQVIIQIKQFDFSQPMVGSEYS